jgi:hypothetical protein
MNPFTEEINMGFAKRLFLTLGMIGFLSSAVTATAEAAGHTVKLSGTRFEMEVPKDWAPGYKDLDDKLLMVYFTSPKTGTTLEGVYLRKVQPATYSMADFIKFRIGAENKRYEGKNHKVIKESELTIGGEKGGYLLTTWTDGGMVFEKHTALFLKDGRQYLVVLHGPQGKVDKAVFDHAVATFALGKE